MKPLTLADIPKRKLTRQEREGNRHFRQLVKKMGVKGFVDNQVKMQEDEKKAGMAKAEELMDRNVHPVLAQYFPKFGYSHIPQARWDAIFGRKEENHAGEKARGN